MPDLAHISSILITGGSGFIGTNYILHLLKTYPHLMVHNVDKIDYNSNPDAISSHPQYHFHHHDINDYDAMLHLFTEHCIEVVVHMAAQSHVDRSFEDPAQFLQDNVLGTLSLLRAAHRYGQLSMFLHFSTDEVYGDNPSDSSEHIFHEGSPLNPTNPYSASKASAEMLAVAYRHSFQVPVLISRCNNVYGPHQFHDKVIPRFIHYLRQGKQCPVHGDGTQTRSFLHVRDVCTAVDCLLQGGAVGEVYNIGARQEYSILEVVGLLLEHLGLGDKKVEDVVTHIRDRPYNDKRYLMTEAPLRALGWREQITLAQGLADLCT